jgi:hypothetical protein
MAASMHVHVTDLSSPRLHVATLVDVGRLITVCGGLMNQFVFTCCKCETGRYSIRAQRYVQAAKYHSSGPLLSQSSGKMIKIYQTSQVKSMRHAAHPPHLYADWLLGHGLC